MATRTQMLPWMASYLHTHDSVLAQLLLDELVVRQRHTLLVDAAETPLVDQLPHGLEVRCSEGHVG